MHEDETYWSIRWSTFEGLVPDLSMIPDRSVFLCTPQGRSLTAMADGVTSLLLSRSHVCYREITLAPARDAATFKIDM